MLDGIFSPFVAALCVPSIMNMYNKLASKQRGNFLTTASPVEVDLEILAQLIAGILLTNDPQGSPTVGEVLGISALPLLNLEIPRNLTALTRWIRMALGLIWNSSCAPRISQFFRMPITLSSPLSLFAPLTKRSALGFAPD